MSAGLGGRERRISKQSKAKEKLFLCVQPDQLLWGASGSLWIVQVVIKKNNPW